MANPGNYINLTASCIRIFMAGFMSDYKVDPNIVANSNGKYKLVKKRKSSHFIDLKQISIAESEFQIGEHFVPAF